MEKNRNIRSGSEILQELESLPKLKTVPTILNKILQEISKPKADLDNIANLIMHDQVLTIAVLKLVNSSYFSLPKKVDSLRHGIVMLGLKKIRDVILTTVLLDHFDLNSTVLHRNHFWSHALESAKGATFLEANDKENSSDIFYVAGLLHDIGELILAQFFPVEFRMVYEMAQKRSVSLLQAEKDVLGITHCDIGEKFAVQWNFPDPVINAIKYHHSPEEAEYDLLIPAVINISDLFARLLGLNYGIDESLLVSIEEQKSFAILKKYNPYMKNMDWERFSIELTEQFKQIIDSVNTYFNTSVSN